LAVRILRGLRRLFDLLRLTKRKQNYEDEEQPGEARALNLGRLAAPAIRTMNWHTIFRATGTAWHD
jgi:hypothetical protein